MKLRTKLKLSIQDRLSLATILSVLSFVVIALVLLIAFMQVRSNLGQVVGTQLQQTVDSSRLSRDLGQFLARLKLLEATFYGNDEYLQQEGAELLQLLHDHQQEHDSNKVPQLHLPLEEKLVSYLKQCRTINELLRQRNWEGEGLDDLFDIVEEIIAERMIRAASRGEAVDYYDQLSLSIAGYRGDLLNIFRLNMQEDRQELFNASFFDLPPNTENIYLLQLRLKSLVTSEAPLNRFGRYLIDHLAYYQHLLTRYQQEMIHLGAQTTELNLYTEQILAQLDLLDQQQAALAVASSQEVDRIILIAGATVLAFLVVLALLLGFIHLNLFHRHIKLPMEQIRNRLLHLQQGDYHSPMSLDRSDEWGQIEEAFDSMLADLVESWSTVQESERRYRNIFDSATEGIFQSTLEGTFLHINPAMIRMFCINPDANIESFNDLREMIYADPNDRDRMVDRLLQEEVVDNYETKMMRQNGAIFWASINCHLVRDKNEQVQFIEGTIDDISQRRMVEVELLKLKEYLYNIVDTMPSVLIGVSDEMKITLWNLQAQEISGVAVDQAMDRPLADVFTLIDPSSYLVAVGETLKTGEVARLRKIPSSTQSPGRFFDLLIYPLNTLDVDGAVIHIDDVTEKVQIEDVMVQSEKMLSVGNLAAGMAHEINNPLAAILQNVQVLGQRLSPSLDKNRKTAEELGISIEQVAEYARLRGFEQMMKAITTSGQRAARIIENMLNFSRKSSSSFLPCALTGLLEKTIELAASDYDMKHHFDFRTISIVRDFQPIPDVPCESSQIQQVILNLLKNAAQALGSNTENPEIRVRVFLQEGQACLQVEDNGPGMDKATCKRIFEPFFTTKEVGVGTGLGLSVSYFLITENHKGSLTVTSEPGQGSCFSILLPLKR